MCGSRVLCPRVASLTPTTMTATTPPPPPFPVLSDDHNDATTPIPSIDNVAIDNDDDDHTINAIDMATDDDDHHHTINAVDSDLLSPSPASTVTTRPPHPQHHPTTMPTPPAIATLTTAPAQRRRRRSPSLRSTAPRSIYIM